MKKIIVGLMLLLTMTLSVNAALPDTIENRDEMKEFVVGWTGTLDELDTILYDGCMNAIGVPDDVTIIDEETGIKQVITYSTKYTSGILDYYRIGEKERMYCSLFTRTQTYEKRISYYSGNVWWKRIKSKAKVQSLGYAILNLDGTYYSGNYNENLGIEIPVQ